MALVERARQQGIAGATVTRGVAGFNKSKHGEIHTTGMFELASDLPMVVTMIDSAEVIAAFLPVVQEMVQKGIVTHDTVKLVQHA